jgi:hypothetical protein
MSDDLRQRYADLVAAWFEPGERLARLSELLAVRDEELERLRATVARIRHLADVYDLNARTALDSRSRSWFGVFLEDLEAAIDDSRRCDISCDDDCEAACHQAHLPQHKRRPDMCRCAALDSQAATLPPEEETDARR